MGLTPLSDSFFQSLFQFCCSALAEVANCLSCQGLVTETESLKITWSSQESVGDADDINDGDDFATSSEIEEMEQMVLAGLRQVAGNHQRFVEVGIFSCDSSMSSREFLTSVTLLNNLVIYLITNFFCLN